MKKFIWILKFILPALILGGVIISFAGVPAWMNSTSRKLSVNPASKEGVLHSMKDESALRQLIGVYAHMDSCQEFYTAGTISAKDPSDSASNLYTAYSFCRKGNEFYYQASDVETIALKDIFISVSKNTKKIFVGPARKVLPPFHMPADSLVQIWRDENYKITEDVSSGKASISMENSRHISCKEYRYEYDPSAMVLKGLYMRLTNLLDPLNDQMDKEVMITVDRWQEGTIPQKLLQKQTYLEKGSEGWEPAGAYAGYTLISLF
ncbi:hypothetical protein QFZ51_003377 [Chitinophaga sp. W3I9]|uniref:hypothetical protein n=1 Tax=unclassified Chitinophaga TaxID=2619133 RepID=UPI003D19E540